MRMPAVIFVMSGALLAMSQSAFADARADPCDDAQGMLGKGQCAWSYNEIAERKIEKLEVQIQERLGRGDAERMAASAFDDSQRQWRRYRRSYCEFTNSAERLEAFEENTTSNWDLAFCMRRLAEAQVKELEMIVRKVSEQ